MRLNSDKLRAAVEKARADGYRPTIKGFVYDRKGDFVSFTSVDYPLKLNFPGGGIDEGECPLYGFHRELSEETCGIEYVQAGLLAASLLAESRVLTTRPKWKGKHLWLYAVQTTNIRSIRCRAEIARMEIHNKKDKGSFLDRLMASADTPTDVAVLYNLAAQELERILT
jgi:hypothetical protein